MSTSEKYISETLMKNKPKIPIGLFIKDGFVTTNKLSTFAVTTDKLKPYSVAWDNLDKNVQKKIIESVNSKVELTDSVITLNFSEETGDIVANISKNSRIKAANEQDNGDIILTIE